LSELVSDEIGSKKVSVDLRCLPDLFAKPRDAKLVRAIDAVNEKFGKGALDLRRCRS
jgi:hypothetical protein